MDAAPIEVMPVTTVEAVTRGEVDMQVSTAKRYPRDIEASRKAAITMASENVETASACLYALPRAGKTIEGGSIRLAEIVSSTYGNLRVQARIIDDATDTKNVTAMASAWDLESNTAVSIEKKRRATYANGSRFNDDMLITTQNANASIAFRDAVFKVVPRAYWQPIYNAARKVAIGDASTLNDRRCSIVQYFAKMGIFEERLLASLGYESIENIGLEDLEKLHGAASLIREGQTTVDKAFPPLEPDKATGSVVDRAKAKAAAKKKPEPEGVAEEPEDPQLTPLRESIQKLANNLPGTESADIIRAAGINSLLAVKTCTNVDMLTACYTNLNDLCAARSGEPQ